MVGRRRRWAGWGLRAGRAPAGVAWAIATIAVATILAVPSASGATASANPDPPGGGHPSAGAAPPAPSAPPWTGPTGFAPAPSASAGPSPGASVFPPPGQVIARLAAGNAPQGVAVDPVNGWVYVTNTGSNSVTVYNGTKTQGTVLLGSGKYPTAAAYNPSTGNVYVTDYSANSVSVINGTSLVSTITNIGTGPTAGPYAIAYNPGTGTMYVAEYNALRVAVINGLTVSANISVLAGPDAIVYDNANLEMYVTCYTAGYVSVIRGTSVVTSVRVGSQPQGLAVDSATGNVYVANSGGNSVMILNTTNKIIATIPVPGGPVGEAYDPANRYVYVAAYGAQNVTVINGTTVVAQIATAVHPYDAAYDGVSGCLYVAEQGGNSALVISTLLIEGPIVATPTGTPTFSADVNQTVTINTTFWYIGTGTPVGAAMVTPASGLGCPASPVFAFASGVGHLDWPCRPVNASSYSLVMNVTDPQGLTVSARATFRVYADPVAAAPQVDIGPLSGLTMADAGQLVNFSEAATLGTGIYPGYLWETFPIGMCSQTNTSHPVCLFTRAFPTPLDIKVIVTDSNGVSSTSSSIRLQVNVMPTAGDPSVNRTLADAGQALDFTTTVAGGSDSYTYSWSGLPDGCVGVSSPTPHCVPKTPGTYSVSVQVTDAVGGVSPATSTISVTVFSDPKVSAITSSPSTVLLGNPVLITAAVSGGWGNYTFNWSGLPPGCSGHGVTISCRPTRLGTYTLGLGVSDENGFTTTSAPATVKVVNQTVSGPTGPGGNLPTLFGMPPIVFYGLFGTLGLAVVLVGAALIIRSRRARRSDELEGPPPSGADTPPPEEEPAGEPGEPIGDLEEPSDAESAEAPFDPTEER